MAGPLVPQERTSPRVSVVMVFLNGEQFIQEAVESVLAQTYQDFELILVDDGSGPACSQIAKQYAQSRPDRIFYAEHSNHANRGIPASRNAGVQQARGEFIAFIDADDVWTPNKLADQLIIFDQHPHLAMVAGAAIYWSSWEGGEDYLVRAGQVWNQVLPPPQALMNVYPLGKAQAPCPSTLLIRKSAYDFLGGFEASFVGPMQLYEDQGFLAKLYLHFPVYFPDACWLYYRQHDNSCMANNIREGRYHAIRQQYLEWLDSYFQARAVTDRRLLAKLARCRWRYHYPRTSRFTDCLIARLQTLHEGAQHWGRRTRRKLRLFSSR